MSSPAPDVWMNESRMWLINLEQKKVANEKLNTWCNWNFVLWIHTAAQQRSEKRDLRMNLKKIYIIVISWHTISHDLDYNFIFRRFIRRRHYRLIKSFKRTKGHFGRSKAQVVVAATEYIPRFAYRIINIVLNLNDNNKSHTRYITVIYITGFLFKILVAVSITAAFYLYFFEKNFSYLECSFNEICANVGEWLVL